MDMTPDMAAMANEAGELELEEDDELNLGVAVLRRSCAKRSSRSLP